jgi:ketosteroid isomerase-like protein
MTNKEIVQEMYGVFAQGDISRLLNYIAENCQWTVPGSKGTIPTAGVFSGKKQIAQFFSTLGESLEFDVFEPRQFIAEGDQATRLD